MIRLLKLFNVRGLIFKEARLRSITLYFLFVIGSITQGYGADPAEAKTVGRVIGQRADLSFFLKVLEKTELGSAFSERTDFNNTIFVPNNKAFENLPAGAVETLLDPRNDDRLEEVFNYHVINRSEPSFELEKYRTLQMRSGQWISINYAKGVIGDAKFTGEVIPCSNGVIYVIDKVLTPNTDDLFQVLQKDGRFTLFTKAITASRQGKLYQNVHDNYTVFAPTDDAFRKLPESTVSSLFLPENDERLEDIIKHHITASVFSASPSYGASRLGVADVTPVSAFGQQLNYRKKGDSLTVDRIRISEADIPTANGLIHVVDSVILPSELSTLEILERDPRMKNLVKLLEASGLNLALADSSKYTIFAPTNEAWNSEPYQSLLENPSRQSREAIFAILARHVITGKHVSENPIPYEKLRTIHGAPIYLTVDEGKTNIQNVEIIEADLEAFNGIVNVIDKVIADPMELPENDLTRIDAIRFTQAALVDGAKLYDKGRYQECFEFFARRGYELVDKYGSRGYFKTNLLSTVALSRDPVREFADNAWDSRNAFRAVLREIELNKDSLGDLLEVNGDPTSKIGR